jgi:uncharacterized membrane protein YbhN (UPF0104 family)
MTGPTRSKATRRTVRIAGAIVGLLLLGAAITAIASRGDALREVAGSIRHAPPLAFVALALSILITPFLTAANFYVLTRRYGTVTLTEMNSLILAAWLLNYLPLWPGMMTRVAYHRAVNRIPVKDSARVIVEAGVLSGLAAAVMAAMLLGVAKPLGATGAGAIALGLAGIPIGAVLAIVFARGSGHPHRWRFGAVFALRTLELAVWASRYVASVWIVGGSVSFEGALAMAAIVQIAVLAPLAPNGLGVREWAIGLSASAFAVGVSAETGLAAGLLDRGVEVLIAVPLGFIGAACIARRRRLARTQSAPSADSDSP